MLPRKNVLCAEDRSGLTLVLHNVWNAVGQPGNFPHVSLVVQRLALCVFACCLCRNVNPAIQAYCHTMYVRALFPLEFLCFDCSSPHILCTEEFRRKQELGDDLAEPANNVTMPLLRAAAHNRDQLRNQTKVSEYLNDSGRGNRLKLDIFIPTPRNYSCTVVILRLAYKEWVQPLCPVGVGDTANFSVDPVPYRASIYFNWLNI